MTVVRRATQLTLAHDKLRMRMSRYVSGVVEIYVGTGPAHEAARLGGHERVGEGVDGGQVPGQVGAEVMPGGERVR